MKSINQNTEAEKQPDNAVEPLQVDASRRKFARSVAGSGIMLTLASQPVLGTAITPCTISGNLSGNLSKPANPQSCNTCGKGHDYWEPQDECKKKTFSYYMGSDCDDGRDSTKDNKCSWVFKPSYDNFCLKKDDASSKYGKGYSAGYASPNDSYPKSKSYSDGKNAGRQAVDSYGADAYKDVYAKGKKDGYYESYKNNCNSWNHDSSQQEYQRGYRDGYEERCKEQYGFESTHCPAGNEMWDFARECLIAVLNCKIKCVNNYGVSESEVKNMWAACKSGGKYQVRSGIYWDRKDCMNYLKKLHT